MLAPLTLRHLFSAAKRQGLARRLSWEAIR
jgi:hypothetical protein